MKKVIAVFMMALLLMAVGCAKSPEKVKIGHLTLVPSLPTYVAMEKGFFAEEGLEVELIPFQSGTDIVDALVAGRIDADCMGAITGLWFAAQNAPDRFKIFLVYSADSNVDNTMVVVVKKDSPLKDLKGLKGKKVGTFPGATSVSLARAIIGTQTDPKEVTFTEIPPPNLIGALAAGQINAYFSPEPFGMIAVSQGMGRYLIKSPCTLLGLDRGIAGGGFAFSSKFLEERPKVAKKVKAAIEKGVDFINTNEQEARGYLVKYTQLPPPVAAHIPFEKWIKIKDLDKQGPQAYFDVLYEDGAYQKKVDTTKLYYEE
ncbi:MAG: ABC transporter substrate-binding protein [Deltaproteobacteria bacterium]|nr:ABC transporter substrate-binding protein [Deltaproteobacteria bacterium]